MPRDRDDDRYDDEDDDRPRRRSRRDDDFDPPPKKGMSTGVILLIVFGVLAVVALPVIAILIGLLLPAVQKVREAASRQAASNNLKQIALAAHNYHDAHDHLPSPLAADTPPGDPAEVGTPSDRLSWRASLLPYIEYDHVYKQLKLNEPWNSPANRGPTGIVVKPFGDPLDPPAPSTRFRCFFDNGAAFSSDPRVRTRMASLPDGTANVILYVESADVVPWAPFNDFKFLPDAPTMPQLGHPQRNGFVAAMADGSVRFVKKSIDPEVLKRCIRANDGAGKGTDLD